MHKKAFIISFEGIEGSGKTTLASLLFSFLNKFLKANKNSYYRNVYLFREPGSSHLGERLRNLILKNLDPETNKKTLVFLFEASRSFLFEKYKDIFENPNIIIFDRFIDSTIAYQGYGMGIDIEKLEFLNNFATNNIKPDLTFLLDVDVKTSFERIKKRQKDNIENLPFDFFEKVRKGFLEIAKKNKNRIIILDSSRCDLDKLFEKVKKITLQKI